MSAFSNVAWIPTLLPSTALGLLSNSPSACFVASDGENLRIYQAVIDARTLLAEISLSEDEIKLKKSNSVSSIFSNISSPYKSKKFKLYEELKVVSQQSTSRPGCIIQLDAISDAKHDWQNTQFLHVFQAQLINGGQNLINNSHLNKHMHDNCDSIIHFERNLRFKEVFYIVIIEKTLQGSTIHMWQVVLFSKLNKNFTSEAKITENEDLLEKQIFSESDNYISRIYITTEKVCTQDLQLPEEVEVIHATPAAGHLSSSSIYPACFAPYLIVTACSDSIIRFWKCDFNAHLNDSNSYNWSEWSMLNKNGDSIIQISGKPLHISAAYSGRIACAFKYGKSFTRPHEDDSESRYINLCIVIYECESSGGSEWTLEDTIYLKNISLPRINIDKGIYLSYLDESRFIQKKRLTQALHTFTHDEMKSCKSGDPSSELASKTVSTLLAVPSFSTLQSLRKSIVENGNICPLTQKHIVQLDWVSKEDGSHILTIAVGNKILLYTLVSSDVVQANIKAMDESRSPNRAKLRKASSLAKPHFEEEICWMKIRQIDLQTADGLPPLPMQLSWARDGILVVAMDSEMHVYSQWRANNLNYRVTEDVADSKNFYKKNIRLLNNESQSKFQTTPLFKVNCTNLELPCYERLKEPKSQVNFDSVINEEYISDLGLFPAARISCPVLPQYHPKLLMEFLNCGRINWVKAILAHLVHCLNVSDDEIDTSCNDESHRQIPEEFISTHAKDSCITPLPLWMLLNIDIDCSCQGSALQSESRNYNTLFESHISEDMLCDSFDTDREQTKILSGARVSENLYFGSQQGQILSQLLTHTHLPGLSSLDQMHLLALADTVCTFNSEFFERSKDPYRKNVEDSTIVANLDECGLRFLLAMKHFTYLLRCLPMIQRSQLQKDGIGTFNIVWAFHSENEEELLNMVPEYTRSDLKWNSLRELGVGFWVKNINTLRTCFEKLATSAFKQRSDPLDAAIYYLAMRKKSIVWGLFRSKRDEKMTSFFANDFSIDRWRKAALKNAYALLGKQRFEHAAAFFLLANSLTDAVEVCLNKLQDFQLALAISRLFEEDTDLGTNSYYTKLLCNYILGSDIANFPADVRQLHPDPFLRSIAYWILKDYQCSLSTLLLVDVSQNHPLYKESELVEHETHAANLNVFNFYVYLRSHPLIIRQNLALSFQEKSTAHIFLPSFSYSNINIDSSIKRISIESSTSLVERQLYFKTAYTHLRTGCPALALEVLNKIPANLLNDAFNAGDIGPPDTADESNCPRKDISDKTENIDYSPWTLYGEDRSEKPKSTLGEKKFDIDVMAQQLKFTACLKILMEELCTLATGFEVVGGRLRHQFYTWLEKEVEALRRLCNYCSSSYIEELQLHLLQNTEDDSICSNIKQELERSSLCGTSYDGKYELGSKSILILKRKKWLKDNEALLRNLLSYCALHDANGGGLASIRIELVLLLQELQQDPMHQELLNVPTTTLPLLSAYIASNKTVISDPIKYLQTLTCDILNYIIGLPPYPLTKSSPLYEICTLRDLAVALSSCIFQCLCEVDTFEKELNISDKFRVSTLPSQWPGVSSLRALISREKDDDTPVLNILLLESFIAIYMSLTIYGLYTCNSRLLYRLVAQKFTSNTWSTVFGGGITIPLTKAYYKNLHSDNLSSLIEERSNIVDEISKEKAVSQKLSETMNKSTVNDMQEMKATYRERFIQPKMSLTSFFLYKPQYDENIDNDSDNSHDYNACISENESVSDFDTSLKKSQIEKVNTEHLDPMSYSWNLLRLTVFQVISQNITELVAIAGIEMQDLPILSPSTHDVLQIIIKWQGAIQKYLVDNGPPSEDYMPALPENIYENLYLSCKNILDKKSSPFIMNSLTIPIRRLWNYLVHLEHTQEFFVKLIYGKRILEMQTKSALSATSDEDIHNKSTEKESIRVIYKEQEAVSAFCINNNSPGMIAIANSREILELDISLLLESPYWYEEEYEADIMNIFSDADIMSTDFLVVHEQVPSGLTEDISRNYKSSSQSGRGTNLILNRKLDSVRRLSTHPLMPLYLSGSQDGSVYLWKWGHRQMLSSLRAPGTFAKVTRCRFSEQGNKFGIGDGDGNLWLWQSDTGLNNSRPFWTYQCHNKLLSDFCFLGSCSLIATAGHSSDNANIVICDTLLAPSKSSVTTFTCHDQGSSCLAFAPQHQLLLSCGKKGDVCVFDFRQRIVKHRFQAHDSSIKCIAVDPSEEFFATGSVDGDIKIWSLSCYSTIYKLLGDHARNTFFKHMGQGVTQIHLDDFGRLFSSGADGCVKIRKLVSEASVLHTLY